MNSSQVGAIAETINAASAAVLAAQQVGATVQASGADKMQAALAMAGTLSPALPPQAQATVVMLQLIYNMFKSFRHPSFVSTTDQGPKEGS